MTLGLRKAQLYTETKSALQTRDAFIASASHELKTPITSMYGYAQLIQRDLDLKKSIKSDWVESVITQIFRLTRLVNTLLETRDTSQPSFNYYLQKYSLTQLINQVLKIFSKRFPNHLITYQSDPNADKHFILADQEKLTLVLVNILTNAAQNSPNEKPIEVTLKELTDDLEIKISDQGTGIAKKDLAKIFSKYHKTPKNTSEGLGLSLFLAKKIITKHAGSLKIKSTLNKGTSVIIRLPKYVL